MSFKTLVGRRATKKFSFLGTDVEVNKLSINQVNAIQEQVAALPKIVEGEDASEASRAHLKLMISVIKLAVVGADEVSDEDFMNFPLSDLQKLSDDVLRHSGLGKDPAAKA